MPKDVQRGYVGKVHPSEKVTTIDSITGVVLTRLTCGPARDNKIYQTHPCWTIDEQHILFVSDRTGSDQLFLIDPKSGESIQITDEMESSPHHSYLSRHKNSLHYLSGRQIIECDFDVILKAVERGIGPDESIPGARRVIASLPADGELSGTLTVDADGFWMYLGVEWKNRENCWSILKLDLRDGEFQPVIEVDFRVGHAQAHPTQPGLIMFCHETGGDADQRMWIVNSDGSGLRPFYKETYSEWVTHEVWWGKDKALFTIWPYNEALRARPHGIACVSLATFEMTVLSQYPFWHVGGSADQNWAVGDTFEGDIFLINAAARQKKLLTQGHRPKGATVHPHPAFSPDGKQVLFCSEKFGSWDLILADIPAWDSLK